MSWKEFAGILRLSLVAFPSKPYFLCFLLDTFCARSLGLKDHCHRNNTPKTLEVFLESLLALVKKLYEYKSLLWHYVLVPYLYARNGVKIFTVDRSAHDYFLSGFYCVS